VAAVRPELAIVSAAFQNRWQFPRPRVVARWESAAARVLNTATSGAVHTRLCAGAGLVDIGAERERRRRFWHAELH
jgi:competence protein ComEC